MLRTFAAGGSRSRSAGVLTLIIGVLAAGVVAAQTLDEHWLRCEGNPGLRLGPDPPVYRDLEIASCTAIIESGQEAPLDLADAFRHRGILYAVSRDYDRAIADYSDAIRLDPEDRFAFEFRAQAYMARGDTDRAIDDYSQMIRLGPNLWTGFYRRARVYAALGDNRRAIEDYGQAIRRNSNFNRMQIFFYRGDAYRAVGDIDRAIADYDMTLRISPSYRCAWYRRGLAYREKGDEVRALQDFARADRLHAELLRNYPNSATRYSSPDLCSPERP